MSKCPSRDWENYYRTADESAPQLSREEEQKYLDALVESLKPIHCEVDTYAGSEWTGGKEGNK